MSTDDVDPTGARTGVATEPPAFTRHPDLASRLHGGAVVWANDELFAERENFFFYD